ncbi:MAG: hypothetical protein AAGU32_15315 [Bacillota bacterium]
MAKNDIAKAAVSENETLDNVADALHDRSYLSSYRNKSFEGPDTRAFEPSDRDK